MAARRPSALRTCACILILSTILTCSCAGLLAWVPFAKRTGAGAGLGDKDSHGALDEKLVDLRRKLDSTVREITVPDDGSAGESVDRQGGEGGDDRELDTRSAPRVVSKSSPEPDASSESAEGSTPPEQPPNGSGGKEHEPEKDSVLNERNGNESGMVRIGERSVRRSRVTFLDDIDNNGVPDLAVASPWERDHRGAVRIYLMEKDNKILKSRHIVPGKWGFKSSDLHAGDLFGAAVRQLHDVNGDGVPDIAVGAPGDSKAGANKGALYILMLTRSGTVNRSVEISPATDPSLRHQLVIGEGFGASVTRIDDMNGDGYDEVAAGSSRSPSDVTVVFLSKFGQPAGAVKFRDGRLNIGGEAPDRNAWYSFGDKRDRPISMHEAGGGGGGHAEAQSECLMNKTHCTCDIGGTGVPLTSCLEESTHDGDGRSICVAKRCPATYSCRCDGERICQRVWRDVQTWVSDSPVPSTPAGSRRERAHATSVDHDMADFCHAVTANVLVAEPIEEDGSSAFERMPRKVARVGYNGTHCACSRKRDVVGRGTCITFDHHEERRAIVCSSTECDIDAKQMVCDMDGVSVCETHDELRLTLIVDGKVSGQSDRVYCHKEPRMHEVARCVAECP